MKLIERNHNTTTINWTLTRKNVVGKDSDSSHDLNCKF